ncbi:MAG: sugar ABC transporter substrate-binding protein [Candidatus Sericytochromatia bacterium]|nr:sugar ABC transporter substrate-binding protein [Candidatus Sericytochromatia bacterium]
MLRKGFLAIATLLLAACAPARHAGITFSTWGSVDEIATLKPLLAQFEKENPDVPVTLVHIPDEYPHKLRLMAAGGALPDVMFLESQTLAGFAARGVFRDLRPQLAADPLLRKDDFYPAALTALSWQDALYAVPRDVSNLVIYYNRDMFDKDGVPYPKADWTYNGMVATAKRLTHGEKQFGIGFSPYPIYWLPYIWSEGGDVMDAAMTRSTLLEPATLSGLQRYHDLRHRWHVAPTEAQVGNARPSQLFAQGKVAMMIGGRWVVPGFRQKLAFNWDVAPFPHGKAGSVVDADASGWGIATRCKEPDKAWRLVRFLAAKPAITAFTTSGLIVPARKDVAVSPAFLQGKPASSRVFLNVLDTARPTLSPPAYDEILYDLIDNLPTAWNAEKPLIDVLRPLSQRIDRLLAEEHR